MEDFIENIARTVADSSWHPTPGYTAEQQSNFNPISTAHSVGFDGARNGFLGGERLW
jgi:hypothetical protein